MMISSLLPKTLQKASRLSHYTQSSIQRRCLHAFKEITSPFGCMTKVVCTLGPSTDSKEMIDKLVTAGMTVARLNFSHAGDDYTYPTKLMDLVRNAPGRHVRLIDGAYEHTDGPKNIRAVLVDTKGPEIRTMPLQGNVEIAEIAEGAIVEIITEDVSSDVAPVSAEGPHRIQVDYASIASTMEVGSKILLDDGLIELEVTDIDTDGSVQTVALNGGPIKKNKGVNLPNTAIDLPALTEKDKCDLKWSCENGADYVAASFIRTGANVRSVIAYLERCVLELQAEQPEKEFMRPLVISKIENKEGLDNFDEILHESDGIMVARGDLGVEIPFREVFAAQKMMVERCNRVGKPVIVATQMLDSMQKNHPEMLDKLKDDWSKLHVDSELKKIRAGKEANQLEKSFERTRYIAECIRLCIRCVNEGLFNYNMKYYRNKKGVIHDYEDTRSITSNSRTIAFLPNQRVEKVAKAKEDDDRDADDEDEEEEESPPNDTLPFDCHGDNMRRLKPHELYLKGSPTKHVKSRHLLTYERHEMANCDTQYEALLVELIQTAIFRSYDLVGEWHCWNRSYFAPVFDHFNLDTSKASKHCSATILVSSEPFENGSVGINADYSFDFNANCFFKNAKLYRAATRKSRTRFTHDAYWLMLESVLGGWREKQNVKEGDHFIPNIDLLGGLEGAGGMKGMNENTVRKHWKAIIGVRVLGSSYTNLQYWQIQSLKRYGIHLDDDTYMAQVKAEQNRRVQNVTAKMQAALSVSNKSRWGKGKKRKKMSG